MTPTQEKIKAIKANIAELQALLEKLEAEDGKVAEFTETFAVKDLGLDPTTVATVVAAWEDYKTGKVVDKLALELSADSAAPEGEKSA